MHKSPCDQSGLLSVLLNKKRCGWKCSRSSAAQSFLTRIQVAGQSAFLQYYSIHFLKMRLSISLLFTLIASSILAVHPLPMDTPAAPELSPKYLVTLTFISGQTGLKIPGHNRFGSFTVSLAEILPGRPDFFCDGLYQPDPSPQQWVYFEIEAPLIECTPCFGWKAYGSYDRKMYVGISKGPLGYKHFRGTWGQPADPGPKAQWNELWGSLTNTL
ncbi:hypothetical protein BDP27DRAFT_223268 [Rhodocollybia butyracea]|uniref:Uncharacterized protein n=1 Tax=Rhodocollybia butyracea TaxID=206335 RepID=A0A9P5Q5Y1_9AGAR|nr:hypothetical protein BDP27DRAFT_223268 [Rhodocollybia butyracea]